MGRGSKQRGAPTLREKQRVTEEVAVDHGKLFGPIAGAAAYLAGVARANGHLEGFSLEEVRDGYEDWHFAFTYARMETDAEFKDRCDREDAEARRVGEERERRRQREKDLEEYRRLGDKLGMRR